jgi:ribosomal protein S18 acetylase RimI-like enzyme
VSGDVTIRTVRRDEWRRWRETRLRMLRDDADFFASRYEDAVREPDEAWQQWVAEAEDGQAKTLLCAVDNDGTWLGVVGGFVRVSPEEAQLISMWVAPEARGRGVAAALVRALAGWAGERGCNRVVLFVQEANRPAQQLYRKLGFRATGDLAPIGGGRTGFKLVLAAAVEALLAAE